MEKIIIKKQVTKEFEIELPIYFKRKYAGLCAVYSPNRMAIVQNGMIMTSDYDNSIIEQLKGIDECVTISKAEFDAEYNRVLNEVTSFEL